MSSQRESHVHFASDSSHLVASAVQEKDTDINILLLGETGVGKSTFINAFANYITYKKFQVAKKQPPLHLIPTQFTFYDEQEEEEVPVEIGQDENEASVVGASCTQGPKSYVFPFNGDRSVRIIDTPGIGDTRGLHKDKENFDGILFFLGQFKHLHGICILLKPNIPRLNVSFEFCIKQLLSKLDKSAADNIIFVFTNSRAAFYRPGETKRVLKKLLSEIEKKPPHRTIPFSNNNTFCTDNEAFRFLIALKQGVDVGLEHLEKDFENSWEKSVEECSRMMKYISSMPPHQIQETLSINKVRRIILMLSRPLADITNLINKNKQILMAYKEKVQATKAVSRDLAGKLFVPTVKMRTEQLKRPITVCTSDKCSKTVIVQSVAMKDYVQKCHEPCYLKKVPTEIIGTPELSTCFVMNKRTQCCKICGCHFQVHMHVYYIAQTYEDHVEDTEIKDKLANLHTEAEKKIELMRIIEKKIHEYNQEHETIIKGGAKFAHFLKMNSILPFNDAYKRYLEHLIESEESTGIDQNLLENYQQMLVYYNKEMSILESVMRDTDSDSPTTIMDIQETVNQLFTLEQFGGQLRQFYESQVSGMGNEFINNREYVHSVSDNSVIELGNSVYDIIQPVRLKIPPPPLPERITRREKVAAAPFPGSIVPSKAQLPEEIAPPAGMVTKKVTIPEEYVGKYNIQDSYNLDKVKGLSGILQIMRVKNCYHITANSEAVFKQSRNYLKYEEQEVATSMDVISKFDRNIGDLITEIVDKTCVVDVEVSCDGGRGSITMLGPAEDLKIAKGLFEDNINTWEGKEKVQCKEDEDLQEDTTIEVPLPRSIILSLLEDEGRSIKTGLNESGVKLIKVVGDRKASGNIKLKIVGSSTATKNAKVYFETQAQQRKIQFIVAEVPTKIFTSV